MLQDNEETRDQISEGGDDKGERPQIGEILRRRGHLSDKQLESALCLQEENNSRLLGEILIENGFCTRDQLLNAIQEQLLCVETPEEQRRGRGRNPKWDRLNEDEKCRRIREAMSEADGNLSEAARRLQVSRMTVYRWLERMEDNGTSGGEESKETVETTEST